MTRFGNSLKDKFLNTIVQASLDADSDQLTEKSKFNFGYFSSHAAGQTFDSWDKDQLCKLLTSLAEYSKFSLSHWQTKPIGKSGTVLAVYGDFPQNSDFSHPSHVPHQVRWGRFRLTSAVRLIGFVVPNEYKEKVHAKTGRRFDCNTFYVVFLDAEHKFYKTEKK
jgi:hypothetical protein